MNRVRVVALLGGLLCGIVGLAGCGGNSAADAKAQESAFAGNPNSPAAQAARQSAVAQTAQKAAAARAAAPKPAAK